MDLETAGDHGGHAGIRAARNIARRWTRISQALRDRAHGAGMDYYLLVTDRPLDDALREYLTIRQGRL